MLWKREIDQEYEFHLASLRTHRDVKYLTDECDTLISKLGNVQAVNVTLRKNIRALEREIYTMCHKNAHNSCIIDGLHELDEQAKETQLITSELRRKIDLTVNEHHNCKEIISMLRHEVSLLENKAEMDAWLLEMIKPHRHRLRNLLDVEKLRTHQKTQEFHRELLHVLERFQETSSSFEALSKETPQKIIRLEETFVSTVRSNTDDMASSDTEKDVSSEIKNEELGNIESATPPPGNLSADWKGWEAGIIKLNADTRVLDNENAVISNLINDFLPRMKNRFNKFMDQCILIYEIDNEIALVQEYIKRLQRVRLKKESEIDFSSCEYLEEKKIILNIRETEETFLKNILLQFILRTKEDFQFYSIFNSKIKELYLETL